MSPAAVQQTLFIEMRPPRTCLAHNNLVMLRGTACPPELAFQHHLQGCSSNVSVADKDLGEHPRQETGMPSPEPPGHRVVKIIADIHP